MEYAEQKVKALQDYPSLKKLAGVLWRRDASYRGAAVMVGAGFSRCAALCGDDTRQMPLWMDFSRKLATELDPGDANLAYLDPLRLAELYKAQFGQQTLNDLIRAEIDDSAWSPGDLHTKLLQLPWSDILTTNWDTLLERASERVHAPIYSTVTKQTDLAAVAPPRITKLHGTVNITEELIFTQEDYRRYPETHAAFVNFSRQVFIENELCLLGFSGEDPNFLQWTGWVRDHLQSQSRRVYLVGALNLSAAKRKYLESINVAPIDLWDAVKHLDDAGLRHFQATELFIKTLNDLKPAHPSEWRPQSIEGLPLEQVASVMESDRKSYPHWMVCPSGLRFFVQNQYGVRSISPGSLESCTSELRDKILYEISWRYGITFDALPGWLLQSLIKVINEPTVLMIRQQLEIALVLLNTARWSIGGSEEQRRFEDEIIAHIEKRIQFWPDVAADVAYFKVNRARLDLNFADMEISVNHLPEHTPEWKLKKSGALAELGETNQAIKLIQDSHALLIDQYRKNPNSVQILSRLAWADLLVGVVDCNEPAESSSLPKSILSRWKCDPWDEIEHLKEMVRKGLDESDEKASIETYFQVGEYKDNSKTLRFNNQVHVLLIADGLMRSTGVLPKYEGVNLFSTQFEKIAFLDSLTQYDRMRHSLRFAVVDTSPNLNRMLSRVNVAAAPEETVYDMKQLCRNAIKHFMARYHSKKISPTFAISKLRVMFEAYARLVVRSTADEAKEAFRFAIGLKESGVVNHPWMFRSYENLLNYSLDSIPASQQGEVLEEILMFPLACEKNNSEWPELIANHLGSRKDNTRIRLRIIEMIESITKHSIAPRPLISRPVEGIPTEILAQLNQSSSIPSISTSTIARLLPLVMQGFTTEEENTYLTKAIYGSDTPSDRLPISSLYPHVFSFLPSPDQVKTDRLVREVLYQSPLSLGVNDLRKMLWASRAYQSDNRLAPTPDQALTCFNELVAWRQPVDDGSTLVKMFSNPYETGQLVAEVLAESVLPWLRKEQVTHDLVLRFKEFASQESFPAMPLAFCHLAQHLPETKHELARAIRQGLRDKEVTKVSFAARAVAKAKELGIDEIAEKFIPRLISLIESGRPAVIAPVMLVVGELLSRSWLTDEDIMTVAECLPDLFKSSSYVAEYSVAKEAVFISAIRSGCAKLAAAIVTNSVSGHYRDLESLVESAKNDPLPEVKLFEEA
ncbi:SIR2 family protein [Pseudomonas alliivorans]|nr:SIR2 family protein [Pseudomonas alliivorans]MEE4966234.1 SIR2 family protein [Pseudomonas alliivorans]MEE4988750.1 SIR2 family protein [Pseudomonas alliivorans]MEE4994146.1 SIR2 family protein [Pseudomonas alliivorans]MEE5009327.1 SIR2 family protein [Pseudomonas alliivorans]